MSLFNFRKPSDSTAQDIELRLNEDSVTVPFADVEGLTVKEVFERFGSSLGAVSRINRFIAQGRIVTGTAAVEAGTVYAGTVASEAKG